MTKPKEYPEGITSWLEIVYRLQKGGRICLYASVSVISGAYRFDKQKRNDISFGAALFLSESVFYYRTSILTDGDEKIQIAGVYSRNLRNRNLIRFSLQKSAEIAYRKQECPTVAELRKDLASSIFPDGFGTWKNKLTGEGSTRNMKDLLTQCGLSWLPRKITGTRIMEFPPPYGSIKVLQSLTSSLLNFEEAKLPQKREHHPRIKMFIQLPRTYEPPKKRRRGRPLGSRKTNPR